MKSIKCILPFDFCKIIKMILMFLYLSSNFARKRVCFMNEKNLFNEEAVLANIKLNAKLEDNKVRASKEGLPEAESTNIKI